MANQNKDDFSVKESKASINARKRWWVWLWSLVKFWLGIRTTAPWDLVEEMLYLYVKVEKARGVPKVHGSPHVELKIGNYRGATRPVMNNGVEEFQWHQVFAFTKERIQATSVDISVKDGSYVIGKFSFGVSEALKRVRPDPPLAAQWYPLADEKGNKYGGELMLAFWTGNQEDEVYNVAIHSDVAVPLSHEGLLSLRPMMYHSPKKCYLRVNVIEAQDLLINMRQAPLIYVRANLQPLHSRFLRTKDSSTAKWNEDLMFVVEEPFEEILLVEVLAELVNKETGEVVPLYLGSCRFPVKNATKRDDASPVSARWIDLEQMDGEEQKKTKFASKIQMRISLDGGYHVFDEPRDFTSDFRPQSKKLWMPSLGVLQLGIRNATGMSPMMPKTTVDAFCVAKYGPKWVQTKTAVDNCSPKWHEQFTWEVYDLCTYITIVVFENKYLQGGPERTFHRKIGEVRIRLSNVLFTDFKDIGFPFGTLGPQGMKKRGQLQLSIRFLPGSMRNALISYSQSLLPKMHHRLQISESQIDNWLSPNAIEVTAATLSRAESPLGGEVVATVSNNREQRSFSLRRFKVYANRIWKIYECLKSWIQWFDDLRKWRAPWWQSVLCLIVLEAAAISPTFRSNALSGVFLWINLQGLRLYRKRPTLLPHIGTELSQVYSVHPDVLAEEFDPIPTQLEGDIVKARYDRLRICMERILPMLHKVATAGEKVQSLFIWRDKVVSFIFYASCLPAAIFFYLVGKNSIQIFIGVTILWLFRPPFLRSHLPGIIQILYSRLPSRADSII